MFVDFEYRSKYREMSNQRSSAHTTNSLANMPENPFADENELNSDRNGPIDLSRNISQNRRETLLENREERKMDIFGIDDDEDEENRRENLSEGNQDDNERDSNTDGS